MTVSIKFAETPEEREAVCRLRYEIYVKEMNLFQDTADHDREILVDSDDEASRLVYATDGDEVVGAMRLQFGADGDFSDETESIYEFERFAAAVPKSQMLLLTRLMVRPSYRSGSLPMQLMAFSAQFGIENGVELAFCDCQPHLIGLYKRAGFRPYTRTCNDPAFGILLPLVMVVADLDYFRQVRSPYLRVARRLEPRPEIAQKVNPVLPGGDSDEESESSWSSLVGDEAEQVKAGFFQGVDDEEMQEILKRSHVIECKKGDRVISQGQVTRTMFVVLAGTLEVQLDGKVVNFISEGEVFGEVAFLLSVPRTVDVVSAVDGTRLLTIDESRLERLIDSDPKLASHFLLRLAKALCLKLMRSDSP
jgi:predicted GNAT family N-acyltransferase